MVKVGKMMWNDHREGKLQTGQQHGIEMHDHAPSERPARP